jgi:hypothetical protein
MSETFLLKISEQLLEENKKLKGAQAAKYNQGLKAGIRQERERITKLLEDWQENLLNGEPATDEEITKARQNRYKDSFDHLFALIKGEQK